jgi:asparaginyl-tRNA synthetase
MNHNGFVNITTPIITSNDCEGGSQVFEVVQYEGNKDEEGVLEEETKGTVRGTSSTTEPLNTPTKKNFFSRNAFLSVSGQLHLESMVNVFPRVYTFSPAFRAEKQLSRRHVSEFMMIEVEEAFVHSLSDLMDSAEHFVRSIAVEVKEKSSEQLDRLLSHPKDTNFRYKVIDRLVSSKKYLRITYEDAIAIINSQLKKTGSKVNDFIHGDSLKRYHEKLILDYFEGFPVFLTNYPSNAFYVKREGDVCQNFDLLLDVGGEVIGGSLRENDYDVLRKKVDSLGLEESSSLDWYLSLRKLGLPPHGGYGLGLDRLIMSMTQVGNIRDVIPFPRYHQHLLL